MANSQNWLDTTDITESDVVLVVSLFNDLASKFDPFKYRLDLNGDFTTKKWYKDAISLIRVINRIGAKPRLYIQAQFTEYKPPIKKARTVPTLSMMASPSGIERYEKFCEKMGMNVVETKILTSEELSDFSEKQMYSIMQRLNIKSEEDFFKDPYLFSQLSRNYILNHPAYKKLIQENFYSRTYNIKDPILTLRSVNARA